MEKFVNYIQSYIATSTNSAIIMTGEWGSGKTYFVKHKLLEELKKSKIEIIYISLNGVKDSSEVLWQIVTGKYNVSQKNIQIGTGLLKSALSFATLFPGLPDIDKIKLPNFNDFARFFNFQNTLLVFDDLERLSLKYDISDFLGFINTEFIESKNYKVLFVANENEIRNEKYGQIKEKVISHTYKFRCDIAMIVDDYIQSEATNHKWFFKDYKTIIMKKLEEAKITNLRTIFSILYSLNAIIGTLSKETIIYHHRSLIIFIIAIINEIKLGNVRSDDIEKLHGLKFLRTIMFNRTLLRSSKGNEALNDSKEEQSIKSFEEIFSETYLKDDLNNFTFYESILDFALTGFLNEKQVQGEFITPADIPDWSQAEKVMTGYRNYGEKEVKTNVNNVLNYAKQGLYTPFSYPYLYTWLSLFSDNKVVKINDANLLIKLKTGFNLSLKRYGFSESNNDREYYMSSIPKENPMYNYVNLKYGLFLEKREKDDFNRIYKIFSDQSAMDTYFSMIEHRPIFSQVDMQKFYRTIIRSRAQLIFHFTRNLDKRYNFRNIKDYFQVELEGINRLIGYLQLKGIRNRPVANMAIKNLVQTLNEISLRLTN